MEIQEDVTVYRCSFCSKPKPYFRKHHCEQHEKKCMCNPENHRPCLNGCVHLKRVMVEYYSGYDDEYTGEKIYRTGEAFQCALKLDFMLHPKIVNRYNGEGLRKVIINDNEEIIQIDMPKECSVSNNRMPDDFSDFDTW